MPNYTAPAAEITIDAARTFPAALAPTDFRAPLNHTKTWTEGALRHVIAALAGEPALVVLDSGTGHSAVAVLDGLTSTRFHRYGIRLLFAGGDPVVHDLHSLGMIIPITKAGARAKSTARSSLYAEHRAALAIAKERLGDSAARWHVVPTGSYVHVTREKAAGVPSDGIRLSLGEIADRLALEAAATA